MVNGLYEAYIQDKSPGAAMRAFTNYAHIVDLNLEGNHAEPIRYKWWWFKQYLVSEIQRNTFISHN